MRPEAFKEARRKMGLTQKQLAGMSGISQPMISWYETGKRPIPPYIGRLIECLSKDNPIPNRTAN